MSVLRGGQELGARGEGTERASRAKGERGDGPRTALHHLPDPRVGRVGRLGAHDQPPATGPALGGPEGSTSHFDNFGVREFCKTSIRGLKQEKES